jgi:hypothetical protein
MRILFLTTILLSKNCNGGEVVSQFFVDTLREQGQIVDVIGYQRQGDSLRYESDQNAGHTIAVDQRPTETMKNVPRAVWWFVLAILKHLPYSAAKYHSARYFKAVHLALNRYSYDMVIIDHAQAAWLFSEILKYTRNIVFIAHNIEHEIYLQHAKRTKNRVLQWIYRREARHIHQLEELIAYSAADIWALTAHDATYFSSLRAAHIRQFQLPSGSGEVLGCVLPKRYDIALLGSWSWKANQEALQWFLQEIYPLLPPDLSIHVAGKGADWLSQRYANVVYRGVVPDAQAFLAQAQVVAIPTLRGGGIQIKTLDAIASGSAIVATPIALRGIDTMPATVQVATHADAFAIALLDSVKSEVDASQASFRWCRSRRQQFLSQLCSAIQEAKLRRIVPFASRPFASKPVSL